MVEEQGKGMRGGWKGTDRGGGSLGTLILLVKQNYLWRISFDQKLWLEKPETIISGLY